MQSLSNILLGDVVLDSFNTVYRVEDSILDQTYQKQISSYFYHDEFLFTLHYTKMHNNIGVTLKPNFMSS